MRLINTSTLQLESFSSSQTAPPYAILSHTWGKDEEEVSFEDMRPNLRSSQTESKSGFQKVEMTCQLALEKHKLNYAWIDTCCIDKSSSAELSESINSMFKWYQQAVVCFAFLADWGPEEDTFAHCKWFTRGWTLQELIASKEITFYDRKWQARSTKLKESFEIAQISGIIEDILTGQTQLSKVPIAVRMSWVAKRITTRDEDIAYCLLGIFDINMPMIYGEGHKAFMRLQEEIIKSNPDMSIFAWKALPGSRQDYTGVLAPSPKEFQDASRIYPTSIQTKLSSQVTFSVSNRGVEFYTLIKAEKRTRSIVMPLLHFDLSENESISELDLNERRECYGVYLRAVGPTFFVRERPHHFATYIGTGTGSTYQHLSIQVSKSLSAEDSVAISRREISILKPQELEHPDFNLVTVNPEAYWSSSLHKFFTCANDLFVASLSFSPTWAGQESFFAILFFFRNPGGGSFTPGHWKCDLVKGNDWSEEAITDHFSSQDSVLSGHMNATNGNALSSLVGTKTLELRKVRGGSGRKRMVLSLHREHVEDNGRIKFFVELQMEDED